MVACLKLAKHKKYIIRMQAFVAMVTGVAVVLNLICTGPMYTLLSLASGTGTLTDESIDNAEKLAEEIAGEGIVLLKNEDQMPETFRSQQPGTAQNGNECSCRRTNSA